MHVVTWSSNTQGGLGPNPQELCGEEWAETAEGAMTGAKGAGRADSRAAEAGGRDTAGKWTREKKTETKTNKTRNNVCVAKQFWSNFLCTA